MSISAATEARVYRLTLVKDIVTLPGKPAYFDFEIAYVSEDEALKEGGLTIDDSFFL